MSGTSAVAIGRFAPLHIGHEALIRTMVDECGAENCLVVVGSAEQSLEERTPYAYEARRAFVSELFPGVETDTLPDFPSDEEWLLKLDAVLRRHDMNPEDAEFWGGSREDLQVLVEDGRKCKIIDRYSGVTPVISATEIRAKLASGESVEDLVSESIRSKVVEGYRDYTIVTR